MVCSAEAAGREPPMACMANPETRPASISERAAPPRGTRDAAGGLKAEIAALAPAGNRRMSANPHANGGLLMRELDLPSIADYAVTVEKPGKADAEATSVMISASRQTMTSEARAARDW